MSALADHVPGGLWLVLAWRAQRPFGLPRFRLLAIAPVAGLGRVTGAVPGVAALGYDIEAALVDPDDQ